MIENHPDGLLILSLEDWTPNMSTLALMLSQKPHRPGIKPDYPIAIDQIGRMPHGQWRIELLCERIDDIRFCPIQTELLKLSEALFESDRQMRSLWQPAKAPDEDGPYPPRKLLYYRPAPRRVR